MSEEPNNITPIAEPPKPTHVVLPPEFDHALIGHSVSPVESPRFAYSLNKMAMREEKLGKCSIEEARERVYELVRQISADHGYYAPIFVDDAVSTQEKPLIFLPDGGTNL